MDRRMVGPNPIDPVPPRCAALLAFEQPGRIFNQRSTVTLDHEQLYEACPICDPPGSGCVWCDETALVPHDCDTA